jgi:3-oxoacyl-[acyl-carrier protein] reductase
MSQSGNKVALVTGGSRGIGRAICERLGRERYSIVVNYLSNNHAAEETCAAIRQAGGHARSMQADVSQPGAVRDLFESIRKKEGRLDVLVNNAGRVHEALFALTPAERFQEIFQTNVMSVILCSQAALRLMLNQRHGHIVNISSVSAIRAPVGLSAYAASKAAVNALTQGLAREVAARGIRVNAVAPSLVETEMTDSNPEVRDLRIQRHPLKRMARAEEVAAAVSALLQEDLTYLIGEVVVLDGGGFS